MGDMKPFQVFLLLIGLAIVAGCGPAEAPPPPIEEPIEIVVTGTNYRWQVRNPGLDGALKTVDDIHTVQELRVPFDTDIRLELKSHDFLYTFSVPELGLREIAVPDLEFSLEFNLQKEGQYELRCELICGILQPMVLGSLIAMTREDYSKWLQSMDKP
jgi:cytochrome c oxidase subunit 2